MKKVFLSTLIFVLVLAFISPSTVVEAAEHIHEIMGVIIQKDGEQLHIVGESLTGHCGEVIVSIGNAPIYNLLTGRLEQAHAISGNISVRAAYIPRQESHPHEAITVWLHALEDEAAVFSTVVSENIQYGVDHCVFLSTDGKYRITLNLDTLITDPNAGLLHPNEVYPGQEFFIWVDMITASNPALVYPYQVVLIQPV